MGVKGPAGQHLGAPGLGTAEVGEQGGREVVVGVVEGIVLRHLARGDELARRQRPQFAGHPGSVEALARCGVGEHLGQALAVLHTMREPDSAMAEAGDAEGWSRMVEAALAQAGDQPA